LNCISILIANWLFIDGIATVGEPADEREVEMESGGDDFPGEAMNVDVESSASHGIAYGIIADHVVATKKVLLAELPYGVVHAFLEAWEKESLFLNSGTISEIQPKVEGLLRAHKHLRKAVVKLCNAKKISLQDVQWPVADGDMSKPISVVVADLKSSRVWLAKNLGIAEMPPKVCSITCSLG